MVANYPNKYDERIEVIGDITLNLEYWDCDCTGGETYIHPISLKQCPVCKSLQEDCPSSREDEVAFFISH